MGLFLPLSQGQESGHDDSRPQHEEQDLFSLHRCRSSWEIEAEL
jgi:hypothetical protein